MTNLRPIRLLTCLAALAAIALGSARAGVVVADFDDLSLAPNSAASGPFEPTQTVEGQFGPIDQGVFASDGVTFVNRSMPGYWESFAYSNETNTITAGFTNQFSVYAGAALSGSNFGVAFGYHDLEANSFQPVAFDPLDVGQLQGLPSFILPDGASILGMYVTNTTYTALSLMYGDDFAHVMEPGDWYKVTAYGTDASGNVLTDASGNALSVDEYLATYTDTGGKWIADQWLYMDLSALAGAQRLYFNMSGTIDNGFGLATPGYFAVDDITYTIGAPAAVPEPASLAMAGAAALIVGLAARRRSRV